jgi:hypothetical protein
MKQKVSKKKAVGRDTETLHPLIREMAQIEVPGEEPVKRILKENSCFLSGSLKRSEFFKTALRTWAGKDG